NQSHAKIYLFSHGHDSALVFGSANLTPDGWGLTVPGCRPNAEILVSTKARANDSRYLSDIGGPMVNGTATKTRPTVQEEVLSPLNAIQVRVSFVREPAHLLYEIDQRGKLDDFKECVQIAHMLIETSANETSGEISICNGWPIPPKAEVAWEKS